MFRPPEFLLASERPGIVHHLSGSESIDWLETRFTPGAILVRFVTMVAFTTLNRILIDSTFDRFGFLGPCFKTGGEFRARGCDETIFASHRSSPRSNFCRKTAKKHALDSPFARNRSFALFFTPFSGYFARFPYGTCALSESRVYLALEDEHLPIRSVVSG